jgi:hypothetical protein
MRPSSKGAQTSYEDADGVGASTVLRAEVDLLQYGLEPLPVRCTFDIEFARLVDSAFVASEGHGSRQEP